MRPVSIWQKPDAVDVTLLAKGQPSKCLDDVGGNISMCADISEDGVVGCRPVLGSDNTEHLIAFLNELEQACQGEDVIYVIVWDNFSFHHAELVWEWFQAHPQFMTLYLPPHSPFLNPIEEFLSTWRWKVYDRHPHEHVTFLRYNCRAMSSLESSCQKVFPAVPEQWRNSLWCWWKCIANIEDRLDNQFEFKVYIYMLLLWLFVVFFTCNHNIVVN